MQDQKAFKCPHVLYSMYRSVIDTYVTYLCHIYISLGLTLLQGFEYCVWMLLTFNNILATYYASRPNKVGQNLVSNLIYCSLKLPHILALFPHFLTLLLLLILTHLICLCIVVDSSHWKLVKILFLAWYIAV